MSNITIVGLGLLGTSMGLAFKSKPNEFTITGHDRDNDAVVRAKKLGAIDKSHWNLVAACEDADLIVLAIPAAGVAPTLQAIRQDLKPGCLIIDTAPEMRAMIEAAEVLPDNVHYLSTNPILPAARNTPSAELFDGISWALAPTPDTHASVIKLASDMVKSLGATPFFLDADEHDGLMAVVESLPMILAASLLNTTGSDDAWREIRRMAGSQFENSSFLPEFLAEDLTQPILPHAPHLRVWLERLIAELEGWKDDLAEPDATRLQARFEKAIDVRTQWLKIRDKNRWDEPDRPEDKPSFWRQLIGMRQPSSRD